jgi:hypothetical protein
MHTLTNAIQDTLKKGHTWGITPYLLAGGGVGTVFGRGDAALMAMSAALIREAVKSPYVMGKLALALDNAGHGPASTILRALPKVNVAAAAIAEKKPYTPPYPRFTVTSPQP